MILQLCRILFQSHCTPKEKVPCHILWYYTSIFCDTAWKSQRLHIKPTAGLHSFCIFHLTHNFVEPLIYPLSNPNKVSYTKSQSKFNTVSKRSNSKPTRENFKGSKSSNGENDHKALCLYPYPEALTISFSTNCTSKTLNDFANYFIVTCIISPMYILILGAQ